MIALIFICLFSSSLLASFYYFVVLSYPFSIIGFLFVTFIYFICFLLIALPTQLILNVWPKKFSLLYLVIYTGVAFIATMLIAIFISSPPSITKVDVLTVFTMSLFHAICYWILDSLLLQDGYML